MVIAVILVDARVPAGEYVYEPVKRGFVLPSSYEACTTIPVGSKTLLTV
jgi:hypothetical protein